MFSCCVEDLNKCKAWYRKKKPTSKNLHVIIGLPVRAMPNQEMRSKFFSKETKWWMELPEGFACPIPPSMGPIFVGRRWDIPNRFGSWFGTNKKLLRGVNGPISTTNDYLNTAYNDVCLWKLQKQCPLTVPTGKDLTGCNSLLTCEGSFLKRKEYAICRLSPQIQRFSLG